MIYIPKKEIIVPIKSTIELKGYLRFQTINVFSGKITQDTGFFPNTILTSGRQIMATRGDWMDHCQVGTDNTAPSQSDTSLLGYVAGTSTIEEITTGQASSAPYYGWKRKRFRFAQGTVGGYNLNEAGIGWGTTDTSNLISRALILDPVLQTPTTITPLADEFLDVTYELRYYSPTVDVIGPSVTLDGIVYDTITRASRVTNSIWSSSIGSQLGAVKWSDGWTAFDGNIGTVLTDPSGNLQHCDTSNQYDTGYVNNSYAIKMNCPVGSTGWNLGAGIRSVRLQSTGGEYQTQFSANPGGTTIPKTTAYTMLMSWTLSWAERSDPWLLANAPYALGDYVSHNDIQWESDINNNNSEPGVANWTEI